MAFSTNRVVLEVSQIYLMDSMEMESAAGFEDIWLDLKEKSE